MCDRPRWGWSVLREQTSGITDIVPISDLRTHVLVTGACWCSPALDEDGDFVHNAADGRERYEQGRARTH